MSQPVVLAIASLAVGIVVGTGYALIDLKSPAPPIIALLGLLGMVAGEQGTRTLLSKRHWGNDATNPTKSH